MEDSRFHTVGLALAVLFAALCSSVWSVEGFSRSGVANPGIGNPVGPATVPQSGVQSGLVRSPNPIDSSGSLGNMIITGNVRAGKHFRGGIPYQSTTDFRAPLGSASLDSFLRYSAGFDDNSRNTQAYRPFYSQTGTVSAMRLGQPTPDLSWPASTKIRTDAELLWNGQPDEELAVQDVPPAQNPPLSRVGDSFSMLPARSRPTARAPQELENLISGDLQSAAQGPRASLESQTPQSEQVESPTSAQYRDQMEQLQRQLKRISDEVTELKQSVQAPAPAASQVAKTEGRGTTDGGRAGLKPQVDILEQLNRQESPAEMRAKLDRLLASASQQQPTPAASDSRSESAGVPELSQSTVAAEALGLSRAENPRGTRVLVRDQQLMTRGTAGGRLAAEMGVEQSRDREGAAAGDRRQKADGGPRLPDEQGAKGLTALQEVNKLSAKELSTEAQRVLSGHEDYDSYSASKFQQYANAGQEYLRQGKYYRAVDAFTLASIYRAGPAGSLRQRQATALIYVGKSLALFAAGEYISSALFLAKAFQVDPGQVGVNFEFSVPKDRLDSRIADAEQCLGLCRETGQQATVGDLQFLLGYIYLRTGKLSDAKRAIDGASKMLPDSQVVKVLKEAIDRAAAGNHPEIK